MFIGILDVTQLGNYLVHSPNKLLTMSLYFSILANRITELEKTLESWCNGQKYIPIFPSQMLLEEFLPDSGSVKSEESKDKEMKENKKNHNNKIKYCDSDDDNKDYSDGSSDLKSDGGEFGMTNITSKTVLPLELELLVKEALAELKPMG